MITKCELRYFGTFLAVPEVGYPFLHLLFGSLKQGKELSGIVLENQIFAIFDKIIIKDMAEITSLEHLVVAFSAKEIRDYYDTVAKYYDFT